MADHVPTVSPENSQHLDLRKGAYRASGSVVRGLYLHNNARKRPGRAVSGSCFSQPYEIYARRVPSGQDQTGVTSQEAWSRIETDQDPLRDSATDSLLPTSMVFPKALPLSHYPAKTKIIVGIRQSPVEMRTFINTGKLKIKVDIDSTIFPPSPKPPGPGRRLIATASYLRKRYLDPDQPPRQRTPRPHQHLASHEGSTPQARNGRRHLHRV